MTSARAVTQSWHTRRGKLLGGWIGILVISALASVAHAAERTYEAALRVAVRPDQPIVRVELTLTGPRLPSRVEFHIDPTRHRAFASKDRISQKGDVVTWLPREGKSQVTFEFVANHERTSGRYDSLVTKDWAVFRGDKMMPRMAVTAPRNLIARTTMTFDLPTGWSAAAPYPSRGSAFDIEDPDRRHDRPVGWMLVGKLGQRSEIIKGIQTIVAAPASEGSRRQDILAFLNWNLPHLKDVFPSFPKRLLIVSAGDPMWRGGLSGPSSIFLHAERPLISENRTSTLLHELVHVAMGIRGDEESDWIVEGLAEYYSLEILRRSGGIGRNRYDDAIRRMAQWAREAQTLFTRESSGATTARAVMVMHDVDKELRAATGGKVSLDDLAAELARDRGEVNLERLQSAARKLAGRDIAALERNRLSGAPTATRR